MATLMPAIPSDMLQMLSRMERFFGDSGTATEDEGTLALDIYEEDDALFVEASVPGFARDDIAVQLHQGLLSIVASRPVQQDGTGYNRRYYRRERPVGAWTRRIALPGVVHDAEVDAELQDGVLKLRIPIPAAAKPRQIQIRTEAGTWDGRPQMTAGAGDTRASDGDQEREAHSGSEPVVATPA